MKLIFTLAFLLPLSLAAQQCWQCLAYAERDMSTEVLTTCRAVANTTQKPQERSVAQFVLARQYMNDGAYDKALPLLDSVRKSGISWLASMAAGLKADCLLDRGKLSEAAELYEQTAKTCGNDYFAPYYLFKAGKIWSALKKPKQAYTAFKTIQNKYTEFAQHQGIDLYIDPKLDKELGFNEPRTPLKLPASPMGSGYVMGEKADPAVLKKATDYIVGQELSYAQQTGQTMTEQQLQVANDRAWQYYAESIIVRKMLSEAGVQKITPEELHAYLFGENGYPVMPDVASGFTDVNTGKLDKVLLQRFVDEMQARDDGQWQTIEQALKDQLQFEKYYKLSGLGVFTTRWEGEDEYNRSETLIRASVAFQSYRSVDVAVSEQEVREYYKQHIAENRYDNPAGKEMHFVHLMALPQHEDTVALLKELETLKREWKTTKNDSLFVLEHSEMSFYASSHLATMLPESDPKSIPQILSFPTSMESTFARSKQGDIIGPYQDGESFRLVKVIGFNEQLLSVRHILVPDKEFAMQLMQKVNHANFGEYVTRYSTDQGSVDRGGEYIDFLDFEMVKSFSDYALEAPIGKIGLVESDFGYHIMEVLGRKKAHYPVCAFIQKSITAAPDAGQKTQKMAESLLERYYSLTQGMTDDAAKVALFDSLAETEGLFVMPLRVRDIAPFTSGFQGAAADAVLRALYGKDAAVSKAFIINDGNQAIVAVISAIHDGATVPYTSVRKMMRQQLEDERRAAVLTEQVKGLTTVKDVAAKWGTAVESRELLQVDPSVPGVGFQPEIVGTIFREGKPGTLLVLPGNGGVCAIQIDGKDTPPKPADYEEARRHLQLETQSMLQTMLHASFRGQIIDNRRLDALGLR